MWQDRRVLIKRAVLDRIVTGDIDLIFRKWRNPTVKSGGQLRTAVGMINIISIDQVSLGTLRADDAIRAGFDTKVTLVNELASRAEGEIYRIQVAPAGPDPRIALRENAELSSDDLAELRKALGRLDHASSRGPWTTTFLRLIETQPHVRAPDLAAGLGLDKPTFKNDVRKLKALGLTISFSPGYEVSPRGKAYLDTL